MTAGDNPPIGILLCTGVGKETAEYLAPFTDPQLFLSEYQLQLPAKEKFTEFLKKENEGAVANLAKGKGRKAGKKIGKTRNREAGACSGSGARKAVGGGKQL